MGCSMSANSGNDNVRTQKGFFKRMLGQEPEKTVVQTEVKQRHPVIESNQATVAPGRTARPHEVIMSPAVKQLNKEGYVIYNTPEREDVYITVQPETAFFDDEEPQMIKMAGGSFVGNKRSEPIAVPVKRETDEVHVVYKQPADIFANAERRVIHDEIDFNEIIIKKNESFDKEIEAAPVLFKPVEFKEIIIKKNESFDKEIEAAPVLFKPVEFKEIIDPVLEESFALKREAAVAATSSAAVEMAMPMNSFMGYREEPTYEVKEEPAVMKITVEETFVEEAKVEETKVEDIVVEDIVAEETIVEEAKVEEAKVEDIVVMEALIEETKVEDIVAEETIVEEPKVEETKVEDIVVEEPKIEEIHVAEEIAETPVTEAPAGLYVDGNRPIDIAQADDETIDAISAFMGKIMSEEAAVTSVAAEVEVPVIPQTQIIESEPTVPEIPLEIASETITETVEIINEIEYIMKLTVPSLKMFDDLMAEMSQEMVIPDDGLESHDCMFKSAPVREVALVCFGFDGNGSASPSNPLVNFRFG